MMYLPRICEHCMNPSCVSSCPSGAMYKREEDGIVLVDQNAVAWRFCVSCLYKKCTLIGKRIKRKICTMCFPRIGSWYANNLFETCRTYQIYWGNAI
ncbi:4Fe-4S dicluster domain-containing protein [Bacillus paranthracis]